MEGVPKSPKKSGPSKPGGKTPRSPKASRKQAETPNVQSQRGKSSATKPVDTPSSPKLQDGETNQPTLQGAPTEPSAPSSADIPGSTLRQDKAPAYQPAASQLDAIPSSQRQVSSDQKTEVMKAPAQTESKTLLPTSSESLATGLSDLPSSEDKAPGSSDAASDRARVPSDQEEQLGAPTKKTASKATLSVDSEDPARQNGLGEVPSPIALDNVSVIGNHGKGSVSPVSTNKPGLSSALLDRPPSGQRMENKDLSQEAISRGQEKEGINVPLTSDKPALVTTSEAGLASSATTPNIIGTSGAATGRTIGARLQTKMPVIVKATPILEDKRSERPSPARMPDPNLRRMSPEAKNRSPAALSPAMDIGSPSLWNATNKRSFSVMVGATAVIVILALVAITSFLMTRGGPEKGQHSACTTLACEEYSKRLLNSINFSVNPCESFTHFVCDGWRRDHELSVNEDTLRAALDSLYYKITGLKVPDSNRSALEKAAVFYRSCECVGRGKCDQLVDVLSALTEAGIEWPRHARKPDVLRTMLFSSLRLRWGGVFSFEIASRGREKHVMIRIADELHLLKRKMHEQLRVSVELRKQYFEVLRDQFKDTTNGNRDDLVSFADTLYIERNISENLWASAHSTNTQILKDELLYGVVANLTQERWRETLRECGVALDRNDTLVFSSDAYMFFFHFMMLWLQNTVKDMHLFVSWCTVQVAALFANQRLLVNFYGGQAKAELTHKISCFSKTFLITGNDLTRRNYGRHMEPVSLRTALDAYRANGEALRRDLPVMRLESLSTEQLFFVAACFTRCAGREDFGRVSQVQCDDTFKHVPEFATVFQCKPGAPMNPDQRCKLL
ncbi:hypothetical protein V5799_016867 [Amblyomma americanum]|uniref:Uncharacterized protein n=1 Tax=Amblyomma americanum TaxID=6943 RepID=A0AAQ4F4N9_AMBAM